MTTAGDREGFGDSRTDDQRFAVIHDSRGDESAAATPRRSVRRRSRQPTATESGTALRQASARQRCTDGGSGSGVASGVASSVIAGLSS